MAATDASRGRQPWHWQPELPLQGPPVARWPPRPLATLSWLLGRGVLFSQQAVYLGLALLAWFWLTPPLETMARFEAGWVLQVWARNLALYGAVTGAIHLWFHTLRGQGDAHRFDARPLARNDARFLFGHQVFDNMFWSLASGVTVWTAFEVLALWAWANGIAPYMTWADSPLAFVAMFFAVWLFEAVHFYFTHRWLHSRALYRFHDLHHNNVTLGPWSGISMHPVEHVLYFSAMLLHLVVWSHPIHMLYHGFFLSVGASWSHSGYGDLHIRGRSLLDMGDMFHTLHHRFYRCNYGQAIVPLDKWFGSFHDGTAEATAAILKRQRREAAARKAA